MHTPPKYRHDWRSLLRKIGGFFLDEIRQTGEIHRLFLLRPKPRNTPMRERTNEREEVQTGSYQHRNERKSHIWFPQSLDYGGRTKDQTSSHQWVMSVTCFNIPAVLPRSCEQTANPFSRISQALVHTWDPADRFPRSGRKNHSSLRATTVFGVRGCFAPCTGPPPWPSLRFCFSAVLKQYVVDCLSQLVSASVEPLNWDGEGGPARHRVEGWLDASVFGPVPHLSIAPRQRVM
jgi:hypothetical protein